jgi:hypothetical protein
MFPPHSGFFYVVPFFYSSRKAGKEAVARALATGSTVVPALPAAFDWRLFRIPVAFFRTRRYLCASKARTTLTNGSSMKRNHGI